MLDSDSDYGARYQLIDVNKLKSADESSDESFQGKVGPYGFKEKRFTKPTEELRSDIMELFH